MQLTEDLESLLFRWVLFHIIKTLCRLSAPRSSALFPAQRRVKGSTHNPHSALQPLYCLLHKSSILFGVPVFSYVARLDLDGAGNAVGEEARWACWRGRGAGGKKRRVVVEIESGKEDQRKEVEQGRDDRGSGWGASSLRGFGLVVGAHCRGAELALALSFSITAIVHLLAPR